MAKIQVEMGCIRNSMKDELGSKGKQIYEGWQFSNSINWIVLDDDDFVNLYTNINETGIEKLINSKFALGKRSILLSFLLFLEKSKKIKSCVTKMWASECVFVRFIRNMC